MVMTETPKDMPNLLPEDHMMRSFETVSNEQYSQQVGDAYVTMLVGWGIEGLDRTGDAGGDY